MIHGVLKISSIVAYRGGDYVDGGGGTHSGQLKSQVAIRVQNLHEKRSSTTKNLHKERTE